MGSKWLKGTERFVTDSALTQPLEHHSHNNTNKLADEGNSRPATPCKVKLCFLSVDSGCFGSFSVGTAAPKDYFAVIAALFAAAFWCDLQD